MTGVTNSPKSDCGQSASQPSRLCQACLSVLERDGLELGTCYPHHSTMRGFVEASNTRCYVCSYLLSRLQRHWPQSLRVILEQLAEGEALDRIFVEEDEDIISGVSYPRADLRSCLRDVIETWDESVSWVSFTVMRIEARVGSEDYRRVSVYLNPSHEGYFPLDTGVYDNLLWDYWRFLATRMPWTDRLLLTSHEGISILTLTTPRHLADQE